MRTVGRLVVAAVGAALLLAGCSSAGADAAGAGATTGSGAVAATRTVETEYGPVEIPDRATRVVAVSYNTPWQLQSLGVTPVGVQDYGQWISEFTADQQAFVDGIATVGSFGELSYEAIAAARPDLIVGDAYEIDEETYQRLSEIAPTAVYLGADRGDWRAVQAGIADATGTADVLVQKRAAYETRLAELTDTYADVLTGRSWAHISLGDMDGQFSVQYPTGVVGAMIEHELGATRASSIPDDPAPSGYVSYSVEQVETILAGADIIVTPAQADGSPIPLVQAVVDNPLFAALPAAQAGNVFSMSVQVSDYDTATDWLDQVETTVLSAVS